MNRKDNFYQILTIHLRTGGTSYSPLFRKMDEEEKDVYDFSLSQPSVNKKGVLLTQQL